MNDGMHSFDPDAYFAREFDRHETVLAATRAACAGDIAAMLSAWETTIRGGGKILLFGNGGSAGDAQHLATELTVRYKRDRAPIAAIALTTDSSTLTAIGNDMGADHLFERQIMALGKPGDVAVGISTSGTSPNVVRALRAAHEMGMVAAGLTGESGGALLGLADPLVRVPSGITARIQEMHILIGQMLCGALEIQLGLLPIDD